MYQLQPRNCVVGEAEFFQIGSLLLSKSEVLSLINCPKIKKKGIEDALLNKECLQMTRNSIASLRHGKFPTKSLNLLCKKSFCLL